MHRGKIAVRKLVEFILRKGSIDNRKVSNHTAQEGARIHRKIQKESGDEYQKEVFLKIETKINEDTIIVEGRADGVFEKDGNWIVDEIKTSEVQFEDLPKDQIELFFYQGMVYAYIYALDHELDEINVQLTYYQTVEELITREVRHFSLAYLTTFFKELLEEYHKWLLFQENWRRIRNTSLQELLFPYGEYRKGQRELAVAAYKTLRNQQRLFVEAPTGTGKTISTLFPAFKALGEERADRVFYLTAKTITRQVAEDAITALSEKGAQAKSVTLTAKDKICFLDERKCNPDDCIYANGYYNRINEGLWDLLNHENQFTRPIIEEYAKKHQLCPFELSLDVSLFCDVIIGDYNYLFDPTVYLRRFFEEPEEKYYFLVDEAHNLVNRSREMYSATLQQSAFKELKKELPDQYKKFHRVINKVNREFNLIKKIAEEDGWTYHHQQPAAEGLLDQLFKFSEITKEWLAANPEDAAQEKVLSVYFDSLHFLKISEFYDDHYETTIEITSYDMLIRQFCIEPAPFLENRLDKGVSSLLFSASFSPISYYQDTLGGGEEALRYRLESPFPIENQRILVANYIQTTYQKRQESLPLIIEAIMSMVVEKTGNYLIFFPSYQYMDDAYALFKDLFPQVKTIIQDSKMNESEREAFLTNFVEAPTENFVGFCVLGGIFSEGIDLKGSRLIGSAIVGVGLPQINHEQELIKEYFDERNHQGFEYAYQLPGMNKVLQAAGRVIRDLTDQGVVLLLDQRFTSPRYRQLFPPHWQQAKICYKPQELVKELKLFWQEKNHL